MLVKKPFTSIIPFYSDYKFWVGKKICDDPTASNSYACYKVLLHNNLKSTDIKCFRIHVQLKIRVQMISANENQP